MNKRKDIQCSSTYSNDKMTDKKGISHSKSYENGFLNKMHMYKIRSSQVFKLEGIRINAEKGTMKNASEISLNSLSSMEGNHSALRQRSMKEIFGRKENSPATVSLDANSIQKSKYSNINSYSSLSNESTRCFLSNHCCCDDKPHKSPSKRVLDKQQRNSGSTKIKARMFIESASETTHKTVMVCPQEMFKPQTDFLYSNGHSPVTHIPQSKTMDDFPSTTESQRRSNIPNSKSMNMDSFRKSGRGLNYVSNTERHSIVYLSDLNNERFLENANIAKELDKIAMAIGFTVENQKMDPIEPVELSANQSILNGIYSQNEDESRDGSRKTRSQSNEARYRSIFQSLKRSGSPKTPKPNDSSSDVSRYQQLEIQISPTSLNDSKFRLSSPSYGFNNNNYNNSNESIEKFSDISDIKPSNNLHTIKDDLEVSSSSFSSGTDNKDHSSPSELSPVPDDRMKPPSYLNASVSAFGYTLTKDCPNFPNLLKPNQPKPLNI